MNQALFSVIITLLTILAVGQAKAQCSLHAGNDQTICVVGGLFEHSLGGAIVIDNGTPPFTYSWSCNYSLGPLNFTASDFLNDTTLADPELFNWVDDSLTFHIAVSDLNGNVCSDSLAVYFCQFMFTLEDKQATINQGDTAQLYPGAFGNCEPLEYLWTPDYNISDPTDPNAKVWPETSTSYVLSVRDTAGCEVIDDTFEVFVNPLSTHAVLKNAQVRVFPNPMSDLANVEISGIGMDNLRMVLYDVQGRMVMQTNISGKGTQIERGNLQAGLYIYRLFQNEQAMAQGKLLVK